MKQKFKLRLLRPSWLYTPSFAVYTLAALLLLLTHCTKEIKPAAGAEMLTEAAKKGKSPEMVVTAGSSIQAAVDAAAPGTVIRIRPGTYKETIEVNKPNITLQGEGQVVIQNPGAADNGITVRSEAGGFALKKVTIRDFEENGIILIRVDGFLLSDVTAINNGEYGLFPVLCSNGEIEKCTASGHTDTGIYVGQSTQVNISNCVAYENVNGLEVENCSFVTVNNNHAYNNVAGILCVLLPGLQVKESANITITNNQVRDNNHEPFAHEGEFEFFVPSGSGILIVGTDNTLVQDNHVTGNKFTGVAVVSTLVLGTLAGFPPEAFADIEPNPDGVRVISNQVIKNGYAPPQGLPFPGVDLLWDGSGNGNCWSKNLYNTALPSPLPACS